MASTNTAAGAGGASAASAASLGAAGTGVGAAGSAAPQSSLKVGDRALLGNKKCTVRYVGEIVGLSSGIW